MPSPVSLVPDKDCSLQTAAATIGWLVIVAVVVRLGLDDSSHGSGLSLAVDNFSVSSSLKRQSGRGRSRKVGDVGSSSDCINKEFSSDISKSLVTSTSLSELSLGLGSKWPKIERHYYQLLLSKLLNKDLPVSGLISNCFCFSISEAVLEMVMAVGLELLVATPGAEGVPVIACGGVGVVPPTR